MLCFKIAKWLSMENVVQLVELRIKGHTPTMSEGWKRTERLPRMSTSRAFNHAPTSTTGRLVYNFRSFIGTLFLRTGVCVEITAHKILLALISHPAFFFW